jgi:hypothetical protein
MAELKSTVWMVHSGTPMSGVKGELTLDPGGVVFAPRQTVQGSGSVFPFDYIRKAHRLMASPVLELRMRRSGGPTVVGFYFVQPPSLEAQQDSGLMARRRLRRDAAFSLVKLNPVKREEIARWVKAIQDGTRAR